MDETMAGFYESMNRSWTSRLDDLRNVGLVSYSGGSKDFQVPDHLTAFPGVSYSLRSGFPPCLLKWAFFSFSTTLFKPQRVSYVNLDVS